MAHVPSYDETKPVDEAIPSYEETSPVNASAADDGRSEPSYEDTTAVSPENIRPAPPGPKELEDEISIERLQEIASKHNVDVRKLASAVPYYNMKVTGLSDQTPERIAGVFSEAFGGLPTKAHRKLQDPKLEAALDDVAEYAQSHKSYGAMATELGVGLAAPAGLIAKGAEALAAGKGILKSAAITGAAIGGAEGLGRSRSGEELESTALGAAGGAAAGPILAKGAEYAGKGLGLIKGKTVDALENIQARGTNAVEREEAQALTNARVEQMRAEQPGLAESVVDNGALGSKMEVSRPAVRPEYVEKVEERIARGEVNPNVLRIIEQENAQAVSRAQASPELAEAMVRNVGKGPSTAERIAQMETLNESREFAKYLAGKKNITNTSQVRQIFAKQLQNGPEFLAAEYNKYLQTKAVQELVKEGLIKKVPRSADWLRKATLFMVDGKAAHRLIDDRLGTSLETTLDDFTSKQNNYMDYLHKVLSDERFKGATDVIRKAGPEATEAVYSALDSGTRESLPRELQPAFDAFRTLFDEGAEAAKRAGLKLEKRANYVPYKIQDTLELVKSFEKQIDALPPPLAEAVRNKAITQDVLESLKADPAGRELVQAVAVLSGTKPSATAQHFSKKLAAIQDPRMLGERVETAARSAYMREGDIPQFIREKNVARLYSNWNQDTFRHLAMRDAISDMKLAARKAMIMGAKDDANYIVDHMKDLLGVRRGTAASWFKDQRLAWSVAMTKAAQKASDEGSVLAPLYKGLARAPELMPTLFNQIYPNFLGLSPRAALMNAAQPFLMTVPELGYAYGTPRLLSAYMDIAKLLSGKVTGKVELNAAMAARMGKRPGDIISTNELTRLLKGTGRTPVQFQAELMDTLGRGISESSLYKGITRPLEKWNEFAMSAFTGAETLNRMAASLTGLGVAQDILGHNGVKMQAAGKAFVERMGSGYRRSINEALGRQDTGRVAELLQNYMISKTIFNYNRATMSAYGRSMGPLLSSFTKWPLTIAGDIIQNFSRGESVGQKVRGGISKTGLHYMAPLALLYAANEAVKPAIDDQEWAKRLLGSKGLVGIAPVAAVGDIVSGDLQAPPVVSVVRGLGAGLVTADASKLWRALNDGIAAFTPAVPALADSLIGLQAALANEPKPKGTLLGKISQAAGMDTNPDEVVRDFTQEIKDSLFGD